MGIPALEYCFGAFFAVASDQEIGTAGTDTAPSFQGQRQSQPCSISASIQVNLLDLRLWTVEVTVAWS
eukprot:scaffold12189_cov32-Cyclotella_meneghiniana.AAC.8